MGRRDNVLYHASVASGTTAGTVIPLELLYGIENVRQGYGTPRLKHVRALYDGMYTANTQQPVPIEFKNSNWIDSAGLIAQQVDEPTAMSRKNLSFLEGRDKELAPNTSWIINAVLDATTAAVGDIYVIFEIEYSEGDSRNAETIAGSPVLKTCSNASVTGTANAVMDLGSFDNLLQGVEYYLTEASAIIAGANTAANFLIMEGFANQGGLIRIFPVRSDGITDPIEGSVKLLKQTYNLRMIRSAASSAASVKVFLEMVASKN